MGRYSYCVDNKTRKLSTQSRVSLSLVKYQDSYKLQHTVRATFLIVLSTKDSIGIADVHPELYIVVILKPINKVAALKCVLHLYVSVHPGYGRTLLAARQCV